LGHQHVGTEHLLLGLLVAGQGPAAAALQEAGATPSAIRRKVTEAVGPGVPGSEPSSMSARASRAIGRAPRFAQQHHADEVGSDHLLLAVLDVEGTAGQVLRGLGVDVDHLRAKLGPGETRPVDVESEPSPVAAPTVPLNCPSCGAQVDELTATRVPLTGDASGDVVVLSCSTCGVVLGVK
jgi:ATP-dependent Clp protease ATP-binding subunit ClpC